MKMVRGVQHERDFRGKSEESHMYKHYTDIHQNEKLSDVRFGMSVIKQHFSSFARQVHESILIFRHSDQNILNSRSQYNRCQIPRLTTMLEERRYVVVEAVNVDEEEIFRKLKQKVSHTPDLETEIQPKAKKQRRNLVEEAVKEKDDNDDDDDIKVSTSPELPTVVISTVTAEVKGDKCDDESISTPTSSSIELDNVKTKTPNSSKKPKDKHEVEMKPKRKNKSGARKQKLAKANGTDDNNLISSYFKPVPGRPLASENNIKQHPP